ncbi:MAG TPA: LacI family DNA-binding transcriptional regulator [Novosphingobium sp.]|nr:LacI family DNA-binding transcriptional regulator [Novosphingobium sp.]
MTKPRIAATRARIATASDVAELAGVSRSAVSRTFTQGASVAPETREKVMAAACQLKYRPNQMARSLMTRRSMIVALAISHLDNQFYPPLVQAISEMLGAAGYRLLLYITHGDESHEPLLDELLRFGVDGLILASRGVAGELLAECDAAGLPVVMMNNAEASGQVPRVTGDNLQGSARVARFLMAGGHRHYAYLAGISGVSSSDERLLGYARELTGAGLPEPTVITGDFDFARSVAATAQLLQSPGRPDALFCANDHMALAAIEAARTCDLVPGRDLSVVGFDNVTIGQWSMLGLTTFSQSPQVMAAQVIELLAARIEGRALEEWARIVPGQLILRDTARLPGQGILTLPDGQRIWEG